MKRRPPEHHQALADARRVVTGAPGHQMDASAFSAALAAGNGPALEVALARLERLTHVPSAVAELARAWVACPSARKRHDVACLLRAWIDPNLDEPRESLPRAPNPGDATLGGWPSRKA